MSSHFNLIHNFFKLLLRIHLKLSQYRLVWRRFTLKMSPIPPNKEIEDKKTNLSNENLSSDNNEIYNEAIEGNGEYVPLSQDVNYTYRYVQSTNDTDETQTSSSDEDENQTDCQIDPDLEFEMLASSRADPTCKKIKSHSDSFENNSHLTDVDVFQRKNQLEPEEIILDESKSKTINNLMANFQLPETSIPEWAKTMPEDNWKKKLLDALNAKKTDLFANNAS